MQSVVQLALFLACPVHHTLKDVYELRGMYGQVGSMLTTKYKQNALRSLGNTVSLCV